MIKVLMIPGAEYDAQQFLNTVSRERSVMYIGADGGVASDAGEPELLVLELRSDRPPRDFNADIVLAGRGLKNTPRLPRGCVRTGAPAVFDPSDSGECGFINALGLSPVTCGTSEKCTVSVSSVTDSAVVLTVGREVRDVYGRTLEVQDNIFRSGPRDVHSAVLGCALLLLTGERS